MEGVTKTTTGEHPYIFPIEIEVVKSNGNNRLMSN
jgi:hypothetical protein